MSEAPKRAWFEVILEDVDEAGEHWTCYQVGLEAGDVDGTEYRRADTVVDRDVADKLAAAVRTLGKLPTPTNVRFVARALAAYEEATRS